MCCIHAAQSNIGPDREMKLELLAQTTTPGLPRSTDILMVRQHVSEVPKAVDREFPLKPDPDRFGANPHPRKANSDSSSAAVCYEIPNQATSATAGARFGRAARAPQTTRSLNLNLIRRRSRRVE